MLNQTVAYFVQGKHSLASIVIFTPSTITISTSIGDKFAVVTNIVTVVEGPHTEHMGCLSANLVLPPCVH